VGADVAQCAVTGPFLDQPPRQRRLGVGDPVLEVLRAHVPYLADAALAHQLPGQGDRRHPAVGEADHASNRGLRGLLGRLGHRPCLVDGVRERLLAQDVLAGGQRR
jgi:hypothetical protein